MTKISFRQRYQQVERIGSGGMGEVFKGLDPKSSRWVAIKLLRPEIASDPIALQRFHREITTHAELDHTNIAPLYGVEDFKEGPCMLMQYVDGAGLNRLVAKERPLEPGIAVRIFDGVLQGMAHAHACGIIHRDLKPANILIGRKGVPKIIDFGIAKPENDQDLTRAGAAPGTVPYMAPEQHDYSGPASTRSDVFSLGIILYELLTGRNPFRKETDFATIQAILKQEPAPMTGSGGKVPEALAAVALRALAKDPKARFASAAEMQAALMAAGVAPAPLEELQALLKDVLVPDTSHPEGYGTGSTIRPPAKSGASRALAGIFRLSWKIYAAAILVITAAAVLYLVSGVRRPAAPVASTPATRAPAAALPAALLPPPAAEPPAPADPNASLPPPPPAVTAPARAPAPPAAQPAAARSVAPRRPKADPAADAEAKKKKALDLLSGRSSDDK